jgi:hypothetical protein
MTGSCKLLVVRCTIVLLVGIIGFGAELNLYTRITVLLYSLPTMFYDNIILEWVL